MGLPTIVLGPGYVEQAHIDNEFVELAELEKAVSIYSSFIRENMHLGNDSRDVLFTEIVNFDSRSNLREIDWQIAISDAFTDRVAVV